MKVYVVTFAIDCFEGLFSTREKAQEFIDSGKGAGGVDNKYYDISEYELDNPEYKGID